jgi:hypothetical protein
MTCPPDLATVLLDILHLGVLHARAAGWSGDAAQAAAAADHVHNLTGLIQQFTPGKLEYYWKIERPAYVTQRGREQLQAYQPLWDRLRPHVERLCSPKAVG